MKFKILVILLSLNISVLAQINGNRIELSASGTFGLVNSSYESSSPNYNYTSEGKFNYYILSNIRFGYFLNTHFEIEPEIQLLFLENIDPTYSINGNITYNFDIDSSKLKPFLLVGYGIGNAVPIFVSLIPQDLVENNSLTVHQINIGFGLKVFVTDDIAIRTEYRFRQYKYDKNYLNISTVEKYTRTFHNILFGISFFL